MDIQKAIFYQYFMETEIIQKIKYLYLNTLTQKDLLQQLLIILAIKKYLIGIITNIHHFLIMIMKTLHYFAILILKIRMINGQLKKENAQY